MAKQLGPFFITGTISGISFYKSAGQYLARKAGGPSKKKIMTSPQFINTRRNLSEFAACSSDGAFLRRQLGGFLTLNDNYLYQRMTQHFTDLKNYDTASEYGQRRVGNALRHKEAKKSFCNFSFNRKALSEVLPSASSITQQQVLVPSANIIFPKQANRAFVTALRLQINFETKTCSSTPYTEECLDHESNKKEFSLIPLSTVKPGSGMIFYFLQIRFYNNDTLLHNGSEDRLGCIAIDPVLATENKIVLINGEILPYTIILPAKQTAVHLFTKNKIKATLKEAPA